MSMSILSLLQDYPEQVVDTIRAGRVWYDDVTISDRWTTRRRVGRESLPVWMYEFQVMGHSFCVASTEYVGPGKWIPFTRLWLNDKETERVRFTYKNRKVHSVTEPAITVGPASDRVNEFWALYGYVADSFAEVLDELPEHLREQVLIERLIS